MQQWDVSRGWYFSFGAGSLSMYLKTIKYLMTQRNQIDGGVRLQLGMYNDIALDNIFLGNNTERTNSF